MVKPPRPHTHKNHRSHKAKLENKNNKNALPQYMLIKVHIIQPFDIF
jgi:hypothetical protein